MRGCRTPDRQITFSKSPKQYRRGGSSELEGSARDNACEPRQSYLPLSTETARIESALNCPGSEAPVDCSPLPARKDAISCSFASRTAETRIDSIRPPAN